MSKYLIALFLPSIIIYSVAFIICLILKIFINIREFLFGTHTTLICDFEHTIYKTRRNFDNKVVKISSIPNLSFLFNKYCGYTIPPESVERLSDLWASERYLEGLKK